MSPAGRLPSSGSQVRKKGTSKGRTVAEINKILGQPEWKRPEKGGAKRGKDGNFAKKKGKEDRHLKTIRVRKSGEGEKDHSRDVKRRVGKSIKGAQPLKKRAPIRRKTRGKERKWRCHSWEEEKKDDTRKKMR